MRNGRVTYYEEGTNAVYMELSDNTGYVYIAKTLGTKTGEGELKIVTMEPSKKTVPLKYQEFEEYMDDSAVLISEFSEYYSFDTDNDNYNDSEIAIETLKEFAEYSIIIWSGHGIYFEETGPLMCTELNAKVAKKGYEDDFSNNRLYSTNKNKVLISKDFFDHYFDDNDLEGSLIYLATCLSGADNQLARVLQDKGAEVVIGSSGIISFEYCDKMLKTFFESLCEYETTIEEALVSAQNEHGSFDPDNPDTQVVMFGNTKFALEYPKTNLDGKSLTGYFTYKGSTDLHQFLIDFKQKDDVISGTIYDEYGEASFIGYIDGTYFQFVKTYKQAAGAEQPPRPEVLYQGEIFPGRHIDGEWQMLGEDYSGYFSIFLE